MLWKEVADPDSGGHEFRTALNRAERHRDLARSARPEGARRRSSQPTRSREAGEGSPSSEP
jgi:hypothetical protein